MKFLILNDDRQASVVSKTEYRKTMKKRHSGYDSERKERLLYFPKFAKSYLSYLRKAAKREPGIYKESFKNINNEK